MPYFNNSNTDQAIVTGTPSGDYTWDDAAQDIDLIPAIHRYAKNVDNKVFHDDAEALDWFKHDRRWKDANTFSALGELNTVAGGWGTAKASKEDLQDLATIRNRWERLPTGGERILQGDVMGGLGAIAENVGKGMLDPTIAIGGIAGKAVGSKLAKAGIGIATDFAVSAAADAAYQAGNVGIKKENPQLNLQDEVHTWEAIKSGFLGAAISTPGHVINAGHSAKVIGQKEIDQAAEQANAAAPNFKEKAYASLRTDKEREKGLGLPTPPKDLSELEPAVAADLEKQLKDKNSLAYTLSSKQNIPLPKVIEQQKSYYDKVSGAMVHVNASDETEQFLREMKGWEEGREYVMFDSPTTGKRTVKAVHEAADKALEGKNFDDVAKDITDLPKGYAANAQELSLIDRVKATAWDIFMKEEDEDKMTRSFQLYWDLFNKQRAMTSEAGRTLNMTKYMRYTPMSAQGVFGKAAKKVSKTINDVTGNTSPYAINQDNIVAIRNAIKSFTDSTTGELDKVKADTFLINLDNAAAKPSDMLWEAWYNGLLSNPSTMVINGIGNVATMALHLSENTLGDAWTIGRGSKSVSEGVSGVKHIWGGYINSLPDSLRAFYKTFTTEVSVDSANRHEGFIGQAIPSYVWDDEKAGLWKFRKAGVGEKGALGGKQLRFPGRVLMATDDMSKIQHYGGNIASAALEEAEKEGLTPGTTAFNTRVAELKATPTPKMQEYANDMMHRLTYTNSDKIATSISQFIESVPGGRLLVPFVRTPWNIAKYAADMLSVPGLILTKRTADDIAAGGFRANRAKARIMMGYGIFAAGVWASMAGFSNGGGPTDPEKKDAWLANNLPWAIKVGNAQVQWSRLDPVALPFAMGAMIPDIIKNSNDEQADAFYVAAAKLFSDAVLDKTWFEGIHNTVNAITDPERYGGGLGMSVARTFVPSVVAGSVRAYDPRVTAPQTLMEVLQDRSGFERGAVPTKLDVFGREQTFESLGGPKDSTGVLGKVARLAVPFRVKSETNDPVANEVYNLGVNLKMPPKKLKGVELNAQQYNAYAKARGQFIYNGINHVMQNSDWSKISTGVKREIVENFIEMANMTAEVTLAGVYPEVFRQYSDPKNSKLYKQFTLPTQKEIDAKTTKPFGNPKLQEPPKPQSSVVPEPTNTVTKPKESLTNSKLSGILSTSGLEIVSSKSPGVSYDPITNTNTITRGPEVSDDTITKLVKGRSAAWKDQTIKVKLEDGSMVDVPAHKAATIMKSKLSKARKLLEEFSSEA